MKLRIAASGIIGLIIALPAAADEQAVAAFYSKNRIVIAVGFLASAHLGMERVVLCRQDGHLRLPLGCGLSRREKQVRTLPRTDERCLHAPHGAAEDTSWRVRAAVC